MAFSCLQKNYLGQQEVERAGGLTFPALLRCARSASTMHLRCTRAVCIDIRCEVISQPSNRPTHHLGHSVPFPTGSCGENTSDVPSQEVSSEQETTINRRTHAVALPQGERPLPEAIFPTVRVKAGSHAAPEPGEADLPGTPGDPACKSVASCLPPSSARSYFLCQSAR